MLTRSKRARINRALRIVLRDAAIFAALLIALGLLIRFTTLIDRLFIYFPQRDVFQTPGDRGLAFEDVRLTTADGILLHGWFVPGEGAATLVWFHGNAGNIAHRVDNIVELNERLGVSILIFDYRGYGRSDGSPSEQGTYLDAEAALAYLASRDDSQGTKTVLFGRSLGCAVALEMANRHPVDGLILESAFTSIPAMAKKHYPFFPGIGALVKTRYDSLSKIGGVTAPILVLHGGRDDIAPFEMGQELFEAANEPKRFHAIPGAGHNDTYAVGGTPYFDAIGAFLDELVDPPS